DIPAAQAPQPGSGQHSHATRVRLDAVDRLDEVTGIGPHAAQVIIAEVGLAMAVFCDRRAPGVLAPRSRRGPSNPEPSPAQAKPARATATSTARSAKRPLAPRGPTPSSAPATAAWPVASARRKPSSPSPGPSSSSSGTCSPTPPAATATSAPTSSTTRPDPNGATRTTSTNSTRPATSSPSNQPPDSQPRRTPVFRSGDRSGSALVFAIRVVLPRRRRPPRRTCHRSRSRDRLSVGANLHASVHRRAPASPPRLPVIAGSSTRPTSGHRPLDLPPYRAIDQHAQVIDVPVS